MCCQCEHCEWNWGSTKEKPEKTLKDKKSQKIKKKKQKTDIRHKSLGTFHLLKVGEYQRD